MKTVLAFIIACLTLAAGVYLVIHAFKSVEDGSIDQDQ